MILKRIMKQMVMPTLQAFAVVLFLIFSVALPIGSMFGVAYTADTYGDWWMLLFIPWMFLLPILCMPIGFMFDYAGGKYDNDT